MLAERRKYRNLKIKPASDKKKNNPGTTLYLNQGFVYDKKTIPFIPIRAQISFNLKKKQRNF